MMLESRSEFIRNLDAHDTQWTKLIDSTFALESTMTMGDVYTQMRAQEDAFAAIIKNGRPVGLCSRGALGFMMGSLYGHSVYSRKRITTHILEWYLVIPEGTTCEDAIAIALSRPRKIFYDDAIIVDQNGLFLGLISVNTLVEMQSALLAQKSKKLEEDLEKRYRAEESLRLANEQLEAAKVAAESANAAKSTFLSNMSHELRTPLNAVIGYSEMLEEMAMDDGKDDYILDLQKIRTAGKHLLELINAILDLSKIEAGKMELYIESFSITKLISDTTVLVEPLFVKNSNTLLVSCASNLQDMSTDATKLRQTLFNLLSNAAKFSHNGTIRVDARSEVSDSREWVVIDVKDTGIGITPEQMSRLFQPFQQADESTTRKYGGTGLGLTISRQFCRMMGGELSVVSKAGEGTTFTVRLPLAQTQVARPSKLLARRSSIRRLSIPSLPAITTKVLSIDDDESMRELLQRNLSKFGCDVYLSGSGESGLLTARQVRPDVIILDVMMPKMDGWSVLNALKKDSDLASIPVIMLTMVADKNMGFALGASDYLMKPVNQNDLWNCVNKYRKERLFDNILIVDDDPAVCEQLCRQLNKSDIEPLVAGNGIQALEIMERQRVSLIVTDLLMPEMDGLSLIDSLQRNPEWKHVPIIVMTSKDLSPDERKYLNAIALMVVEKNSIPIDDLFQHIGSLIKSTPPIPMAEIKVA